MRSLGLILVTGLLGIQQPTAPSVEAWEKPIAPGLLYRTEIRPGPVVVHAVRQFAGSEGVRATAAVPGKTVYADNATMGRGTVGQMVRDYQALGGINADFFPLSRDKATGDPLGFMAANGELISSPARNRSHFAWGPSGASVGAATVTIRARTGTAATDGFAVDAVNQECALNQITLNAPVAGLALSYTSPTVSAVLKADRPVIPMNGTLTAEVEYLLPEAQKTPIPAGRLILTAQGNKVATLTALKPGTILTFEVATQGVDGKDITDAVGGGPRLLRAGQLALNPESEGFSAAFSTTRHPRTAVGHTAEGDIWWVVIDGRSKHSIGASLTETAQIMKELGCVEATNLDGGGSSALHLAGASLNRPSDGQERAVANGVVFSAPVSKSNVKLSGLSVATRDGKTFVTALDDRKRALPAIAVIFTATGGGWITPAGEVRALAKAPIKVRAWLDGQTAEITVPGEP
ncbi:MAG: phosphodiester glycosidase family protein [Fimbriimonadaceae bacterium]|nr:phosphodiester glycosidase family protein [Fimbriimonadaceae bacterium]